MIAMAWKHPNIYIGLDAYAPKHWPAETVHYANTFGQDKVIFGSDWPVIDPERAIVDEYLEELDWEKMMRTITARSRKEPSVWDHERYERNYAEPGPNNLARHSIGHGCVEHGPGTWDLIEGSFS